MSLITLTVKEKDTNVYATAKSQEFDSERIKRVAASGSDSLVHYYDAKESRVVEYLVDETDTAILALVSELRFENTLFVDGNPTAASNDSVLYNTVGGYVSSVITDEGFKRVTYDMGEENNSINREMDLGSEVIDAVSGTKTFTVTGDQTKVYKNGDTLNLNGSPDNDGAYTVNGDSTLVGTDTEIVVVEAINSTAGGFLSK